MSVGILRVFKIYGRGSVVVVGSGCSVVSCDVSSLSPSSCLASRSVSLLLVVSVLSWYLRYFCPQISDIARYCWDEDQWSM